MAAPAVRALTLTPTDDRTHHPVAHSGPYGHTRPILALLRPGHSVIRTNPHWPFARGALAGSVDIPQLSQTRTYGSNLNQIRSTFVTGIALRLTWRYVQAVTPGHLASTQVGGPVVSLGVVALRSAVRTPIQRKACAGSVVAHALRCISARHIRIKGRGDGGTVGHGAGFQ